MSNAVEASAQSRRLWKGKAGITIKESSAVEGCAEASWSDNDGEWSDEDSVDESGQSLPHLIVKPSTISNAGDGLYLASSYVATGGVFIEEDAVSLRRGDAKKVGPTHAKVIWPRKGLSTQWLFVHSSSSSKAQQTYHSLVASRRFSPIQYGSLPIP